MDKMLAYRDNKYLLAKASMYAIDKTANMKDYPEEEEEEIKSAITVLEMVLDGKVQFELLEEPESEES